MRKTISSTVNYFVIVNATKADCTQNIRYSICMYTYRTEYLHQCTLGTSLYVRVLTIPIA